MKRLAITFALLAACAAAAWTAWYAWFIVPAKTSVAMGFKEPFAVQFEDIRFKVSNGIAVCGRFNAKDSAGAYMGFRRFVYINATGTAYREPTQDDAETDARKTADELARKMISARCGE